MHRLFQLGWLRGVVLSGVAACGQIKLPVGGGSAACQVGFAYEESVEKNTFSLLKLLSMANDQDSPLSNPKVLGLQYAQLASSRQYHEGQAAGLPACTVPLNNELIRTMAATQDVLTMMMAAELDPGILRYDTRIDQALVQLNDRWMSFSQIRQDTQFSN